MGKRRKSLRRAKILAALNRQSVPQKVEVPVVILPKKEVYVEKKEIVVEEVVEEILIESIKVEEIPFLTEVPLAEPKIKKATLSVAAKPDNKRSRYRKSNEKE